MKVTLNWLKQYVDFDWSPEELANRLTMLGIEVEGIQKAGGEFEGIVVAQVITRDKHPNADKLSLCRVHDGRGERQIVCGAQNFKAGDKVPLILPGASLPLKPGEKEPFTIRTGKIRGVESQGLMCPRYTARVVQGVKIGPSPDWLRATLEKVGIRSISNVVDVSNYVMLETGQPLHTFDYRLLGSSHRGPAADPMGSSPAQAKDHKPTILVRRAAEGEKFTTLDGQERALTTDMLLIADEHQAIALAGIMGGRNTEIDDRTTDVLIESAWFQPTNIRR